jgi:glycosyltransferase involved in cell wall biosynthesis
VNSTDLARPLVSVVIPVRNRAGLLARAVRSVLAQSHSDLEIVVVDDGSEDDPRATIASFGDSRIRIVTLTDTFGAGRARNEGIRAARGRWIAFLDSDDEWLPRKLELQLTRASDPRTTVVYCLSYCYDGFTAQLNRTRTPLCEGDVLDRLLRGWVLPTTSVAMIDRAALLAVGGFTETLPSRQDYDLWLKLAQAGNRFAAVDEPLVIKHESHGAQIIADPAARLEAGIWMRQTWGALVRSRHGRLVYYGWIADGYAIVQRAYLMRVKNDLDNGRRVAAWRHCGSMLRYLFWSRRFLLQALLLLLFGKKTYGALRRLVLKDVRSDRARTEAATG